MGKWVDKAGLQYVVDWAKSKFNSKVDKVEGKGLSTNDFDDAAAEKLNSLDLSGYVAQEDLMALTREEIDEITGSATSTESFVNLLSKSGFVELGDDLTVSEPITISEDVTIDLCGSTLSGGNQGLMFNVDGATLTLRGEGEINTSKSIATAFNGGKIIIEDGTYVSNTDVAFRASGEGSKVTIKDADITAREGGVGAFYGGEIQMDGGTITGIDNFAIFTNGSSGQGGNTIILNGGKLVGNIVSNGYEACGIYIANNDTFEMNGGEIIANGGAGLLMRGGNVTINGGTITALGEPGEEGGWIGDNKTKMSKSAIIYHESANYPGKAGMSLEINGGTFNGVDHSLEILSNEAEPNVTVNGGDFTPAYPEE